MPLDPAALLARHHDPTPHGRWLSNGRYALLLAAARLATTGAPPPIAALAGPAPAPRDGPRSERLVERPLAHRRLPPTDNGFGRFVADGREYAIELGPGPDGELARPPMPWCNVVANERVGFVASEGGAATTWAGNGRENRLTPWSNDPVADPPGEALWLRDEEAGVFWSPLPAPAASGAPFTVSHGLGYTMWSHQAAGLAQEVTRFVPLEDPLAVCRVRIENRSGRPRRLTLFALQRLVIGATPEDGGRTVVTDGEPAAGALVAENAIDPGFGAGVAFGTVLAPPGVAPGYTTDRAGFVGRGGTLAAPAAVTGGAPLDGALGADLDPCFAWRLALALAPGAAAECSFLLGQERDRAAVRALLARWRAPGAVERALGKVHAEWERLTGALRVRTPVAAFDQLAGGWLLHQALGCRQRGRSGFYQPGGAFGFRDQLQDAAALVWAAPEHTRSQLVLHAAHQFVEGDVLHGWHPPGSKGIRTRRSDDPAWLPYVTAVYVGATGDEAVLDEPVPFLRARGARAPGSRRRAARADHAPVARAQPGGGRHLSGRTLRGGLRRLRRVAPSRPGGWTWSAGSAGGLYRVLVETVLGLRLEAGRRLRLRPRIPDAWPGFELLLRAPDGRTRYAIRADNPGGRAGCVVGAQVDGRTAAIEDGAALVPLASDGALHEVRVLLG